MGGLLKKYEVDPEVHCARTHVREIMTNDYKKVGNRVIKMKGGKSEGETNHERLWTLRNKLRVLAW